MPKPMPLLGFQKYEDIKDELKKSSDDLVHTRGGPEQLFGPYPNELTYPVPLLDLGGVNYENVQQNTVVSD